MIFLSHKRGFTLIELMMVIAIIGVLSSVILSSLNSARSQARDARRIAGIKQLQNALDLHYDTYGHFPRSSLCGSTVPNGSWCNSVQPLSGGHWIRDLGTADVLAPFLADEPIDPLQGTTANWTPVGGGSYYYYSDGRMYMIVYGLENRPNKLESVDGVTACNSQYFHYGTGSNGVLTVGSNCR